MAELKAPEVNPENNTPQPPAPNQQPPEGEKEFIAGKFKTQGEFVKSYDELQSKLGSMGEEVGTLKGYIANASTLVNALYTDPDIKKIIEQKYVNEQQQGQPQGQQQQAPQQQQPTAPPTDPKVTEMENAMRIDMIAKMDGKFNIKGEELEEVHKNVGKELAAMGYDIRTIPVDIMPGMLDRAFKLSFPEKVLETAKQEGAAQMVTNMQAQVPSQGGGSIQERGAELNPEQKEWIKKLGKSEGDVQKVLSNPEKA